MADFKRILENGLNMVVAVETDSDDAYYVQCPIDMDSDGKSLA